MPPDVSVSLRKNRPPTSRRPTGGEQPATNRQQPTPNDTRRQGQRPDRSIAAGDETAVLVFTAMMLAVAAVWV
jgi:hypothetical protein